MRAPGVPHRIDAAIADISLLSPARSLRCQPVLRGELAAPGHPANPGVYVGLGQGAKTGKPGAARRRSVVIRDQWIDSRQQRSTGNVLSSWAGHRVSSPGLRLDISKQDRAEFASPAIFVSAVVRDTGMRHPYSVRAGNCAKFCASWGPFRKRVSAVTVRSALQRPATADR